MKITVDTNIVFSAILNSQGRIGQLIIIGSEYFEFYSINLLEEEIFNHENKILKSSGMSKSQNKLVPQRTAESKEKLL